MHSIRSRVYLLVKTCVGWPSLNPIIMGLKKCFVLLLSLHGLLTFYLRKKQIDFFLYINKKTIVTYLNKNSIIY